jgi:hypothetical protein
MGDYKVRFIRSSIVKKELFRKKEGAKEIKIRISAEATDNVFAFLDKAVEAAVQELIAKLPTKSKGDHKGELKRITLLSEDFEE